MHLHACRRKRKVVCGAALSIAYFLVAATIPILPPCHGFSTTTTTHTLPQYSSNSNRACWRIQSHSNRLGNDEVVCTANHWLSVFGRTTASVLAGVLSVAISTSGVVGLPASENAPPPIVKVCHALTPDQLLVDDVWREVSRQFVDPTYNGQGEDGWKKQRLLALAKASDLGPDDDSKLYAIIREMLKTLEDPYTRFLTPEQFESMTKAYATTTAKQDNNNQPTPSTSGIGVQLIGDNNVNNPNPGMVVVVNTIASGPAEKVGILPGDRIRSVDGVDMVGATAEIVAARCRGETGTTVAIEVERPPIESSSSKETTQLALTVTRTPLAPTPMLEATTTILSSASNKDQTVGIVKINSFTQDTERAVREELQRFSNTQTLSAIVLDLRGNVGGYMPAGVDVAKLFLPSKTRIVSEVDKTGRATIYINDGVGGSDTLTRLYVVVDRRTASASEILAAALQDNQRATVVSSEPRTFGKGRIQNVQALSQGGSGIAVTKAKYITPSGRDIQGVGILPDVRSSTCTPKDSAAICLEGIL